MLSAILRFWALLWQQANKCAIEHVVCTLECALKEKQNHTVDAVLEQYFRSQIGITADCPNFVV
jgi:hypothetical protein